jgi:ligand-binding sensor domain-containing protein
MFATQVPTTADHRPGSSSLGAMRFLARACCFGALVASSGSHLIGQTSIPEMYHKAWTTRDGVPPHIEDIAKGPDGLLWLATDRGLYRFDGVTFDRYIPPAGSELLSEGFSAISVTRDGSLWGSYIIGGVARIRNDAVTNYPARDGLRADRIHEVVEDQNGLFWLVNLPLWYRQSCSSVVPIHTVSPCPSKRLRVNTW